MIILIAIIPIIISILSLLLSIYNLAYALLCKRCRIKFIIHAHYFNNKTHQFFVTIQNQSQLPISISSIKMNESIFCILEPCLVKENIRRSGKEIVSRVETKTIQFPINLNSLEGKSGYLEFRNVEDFDINNINFSFFTNRKSIQNIAPIIDDDLAKKL